MSYHENLNRILDDDKAYEDLAERRKPIYSSIAEALEVVKAFIKRKKLVLYGGIAIDYGLKAAGHEGIYAEDAIPDYDFASPDFFTDSNELADILHAADFPNVSSINALHVTTRRVRVDYEVVADISWYPKPIYDCVEYLEYNGMRYVHPNIQRMDMHLELCYPFDNPPMEVIQHRTRKTIKRFKLFNEVHPLTFTGDASKIPTVSLEIPYKSLGVDSSSSEPPLVGGVVGYALMYHAVHQMFFDDSNKLGKSMRIAGVLDEDARAVFDSLWNPEISLGDSKLVIARVPKSLAWLHLLSFAGDFGDEAPPPKPRSTKTTKYINKHLDYIRPPTVIRDADRVGSGSGSKYATEIYDLSTKRTPYFPLVDLLALISAPKKAIAGLKTARLPIVHMTLLYFLQKWHEGARSDDAPLAMYDSLFRLADMTERLIVRLYKIGDKSLKAMVDEKIYPALPFFLTARMAGHQSMKEAYVVFLKETGYQINKTPREERQPLRPPFTYAPSTYDQSEPPSFDPSTSVLFTITGQEV